MPIEEQPIELRSSRAVERGHLLVGQHAGHQHVVLDAVHLHPWRVDVASGTGWPRSRSHFCIIAISSRWATTMRSQRIATSCARAVRRRPAGHDDRLRVMRNHAGHEIDVGVAVRQSAEPGRRGVQTRRRCARAPRGCGDEEHGSGP